MKIKFLILTLLALAPVAFIFKEEIQQNPVFKTSLEKIEEKKKELGRVLGKKIINEGGRLKEEKEPEIKGEVSQSVEKIKEEIDEIVKAKIIEVKEEVKEISQEEIDKLKKEIVKEVKKEICEKALGEE